MAPRGRRIWLAGGAAVVVAVAGIAVYVGRDGTDSDGTSPGSPTPTATESSTPDPAVDAARVRDENRRSRRAAAREAERVLASMPVPEGAKRVRPRDVPPLKQTTLFSGNASGEFSVTRTAYWLVERSAEPLADWYSLHPPRGMASGPHEVGGHSNIDGSWSLDVFYNGVRSPAVHSSADVQVTPVEALEMTSLPLVLSGVRISVTTVWRPTRPAASFTPDDVTSVRIVAIRRVLRPGPQRHTFEVADPQLIQRLAARYDALPGWPEFLHSCPPQDQLEYRLIFLSPTRKVAAQGPLGCYDSWAVTIDGRRVEPYVDDFDHRLTELVARVTKRR